jgi:hypothetical protein
MSGMAVRTVERPLRGPRRARNKRRGARVQGVVRLPAIGMEEADVHAVRDDLPVPVEIRDIASTAGWLTAISAAWRSSSHWKGFLKTR